MLGLNLVVENPTTPFGAKDPLPRPTSIPETARSGIKKATKAEADASFIPAPLRREKGYYGDLLSSAIIESKESEEEEKSATEPVFTSSSSAFEDEDGYLEELAQNHNISGLDHYISLFGFDDDKLGWVVRVAARYGHKDMIEMVLSKGSIHPDHISESFVLAGKYGNVNVIESLMKYPISKVTINRALREAYKANQSATIRILTELLVNLR